MTCAANMNIWDSNIASCKQRVLGRIFYVTLPVFLGVQPFQGLVQKCVKIMAFGCNTELFVMLIACLPNLQAAPFSTRLLHKGCFLFTSSWNLFSIGSQLESPKVARAVGYCSDLASPSCGCSTLCKR